MEPVQLTGLHHSLQQLNAASEIKRIGIKKKKKKKRKVYASDGRRVPVAVYSSARTHKYTHDSFLSGNSWRPEKDSSCSVLFQTSVGHFAVPQPTSVTELPSAANIRWTGSLSLLVWTAACVLVRVRSGAARRRVLQLFAECVLKIPPPCSYRILSISISDPLSEASINVPLRRIHHVGQTVWLRFTALFHLCSAKRGNYTLISATNPL